jgi:hypothetical protein
VLHRIRAYVDTSVFGGTQDEEFVVESNGFFDQVRLGAYVVLLSDETQRELADSPDAVQSVWLDLPPASVELIDLGDEARSLADEYVNAELELQAHRQLQPYPRIQQCQHPHGIPGDDHPQPKGGGR